ncbi:hypothetical protein LXL04_039059 [Taraxacum kok-saghyz]
MDLDSVMGTVTRIPRLSCADGFSEWKFRIESYIKMAQPKVWRCMMRGPVKITFHLNDEAETVVEKPVEDYTDAEWVLVEEDHRALAVLTMALTPDIAQGFREYTDAKSLWKALIAVYEGNDDMRQSRQDLLRQKFNMFNHILGESLENQLQRFTTLTTEISTAGILLPKSEVNKKLLNSLHEKWDMNVFVIKKTSNLNTMTLAETLAVIKAFDMDITQREINRAGYNAGRSSNSAFATQPSMVASSPSYAPVAQVYSAGSNSSVPATHTEENLGIMAGNCYKAVVNGKLSPPVLMSELDQIHPDDVEEMDISWAIGMAVFRAKKFTQRTGRNAWGSGGDRKMGYDKSKLRCYNCHEEGHFARECSKPKVEHHNNDPNYHQNNVRTMVPAGDNNRDASANNDRALVAQKFSWEDQLNDLNLGDHHAANLAQVEEAEEAEDQILDLQHAFMVSATPEKEKVSETSCSPACTAKFKSYREQKDLLIREVEDLKYDACTLRRSQMPLKEKLEAATKDYHRMQAELSLTSCRYKYTKNQLELLTAELDTLKGKFKNADFNFKKFEVSSAKVETMIETQLKFKDQKTEGLGYNNVPPPYNDNYTPVLEPVVLKRPPPVDQSNAETTKLNKSNASTSCADTVLVEDWTEEEDSDSDTVKALSKTPLNSVNSAVKPVVFVSPISGDVLVSTDNVINGDATLSLKSNSTVEKYKPKKFVRQSDKCTCNCGNSGKEKQIPKRDPQTSRRTGPSPQLDRNIMKRQTCFYCGFAGHIARNCPNPPAVPVHAHHLRNLSKGDSTKRIPFISGSNDSDWRANKTRTKILTTREKTYVRRSGPREGGAKPKIVRQKPSQRQPINHHSKQKPTKKGKPNVSSSVVQHTRLDKRPKPVYRWVPKPIYRWVPKVPAYKSSNHPDMVWERVPVPTVKSSTDDTLRD